MKTVSLNLKYRLQVTNTLTTTNKQNMSFKKLDKVNLTF